MNTPSVWFTNPDVIWSGVIAATLALAGVILTVWINSKNIRCQLEHDAEERERERKASLRREVFLAAVEEFANAQSYLSALPQTDLTDPVQASGTKGFFAASAKLQVVCEPETALLVGELVGAFTSLLLRMLGEVASLHGVRGDIDIRTYHYNRFQTEIDRVLAAMTANNESGKPDSDKMSVLQRAFEFNQGQAKKVSDERNALFDKRNALQIAYSRALLKENREILPLHMKVMEAIRKELNLQTDSGRAHQQMEAQMKQFADQMDGLFLQLQGPADQ